MRAPREDPFGQALVERGARLYASVMRHRERYLRAWIAATGLHPEECEVVEETHPMGDDGIVRVTFRVQRATLRWPEGKVT